LCIVLPWSQNSPTLCQSMASDEKLGPFREAMSSVRVPSHYDRVYNDECVFSFDTPFSDEGLYVSLSNWQGVGRRHLERHAAATNSKLYLHVKKTKTLKPVEEADAGADKQDPTTLNDLLQASLPQNKYDVEEELTVTAVPEMIELDLADESLPIVVSDAAKAVASHQAAGDAEEVVNMVEEEDRPVSKYADGLVQLDNGVKISPDASTWACAESGMKENLWLNLSDGHIGSGRRNWDGSGGTNGALNHFESTGNQYPLVVKLGTITPSGADVYSYAPDEDRMVKDPKLAEHLAHWGINIMELEKTEKTMAELELDLNKNHEFFAITEQGSKLQPVSGPELTGLVNLGNSCYMNSTIQLLLAAPQSPFKTKYASNADAFRRTASPEDPANDPLTQLAKLADGLVSGDYAPTALGPVGQAKDAPPAAASEAEEDGGKVRPRMFKTLVGRGHAEFSTGRQQDAAEYFQHLLEFFDRAERGAADRLAACVADAEAASKPLSAWFTFAVQSRLECSESHTVRYKSEQMNTLSLQIPLDAAVNASEVEEQRLKRARVEETTPVAADATGTTEATVLPRVPLSACLDRWFAPTALQGWKSPALGGREVAAEKRLRFDTFPPFLLIQAQRFYQDESWTVKKMEVVLDVPDTLDLTSMRALPGAVEGSPLQENEVAMPEDAAEAPPEAGPPQVEVDEAVLAQLMSMGFAENGCRRAALATANNVEAATEWIFAHMQDADFNDPPSTESAPAQGSGGPEVNPETVMMLTSMGFSEEHVRAVLESNGGDAERAADWLFSHSDDLDAAVAGLKGESSGGATSSSSLDVTKLDDGRGTYRLRGFISHIGRNTGSGHYVAHVRKHIPDLGEDRWVIFNDQSVALSEAPPREHAYLYLYERI